VREGPALHMAETARDMWQTGSIQGNHLSSIYDQLITQSKSDGQTYWQDVFAIGKNGEVFPKKCIFFSFVSAPFYGLFGDIGFWLLSQLLILAILLSMYHLVRELAGECAGFFLILLTFVGTEFLIFFYQFDPDVLSAALIICAIDLMRRYRMLGGFLLGLSVFTRPTHALTIPVLFLCWKKRGDVRGPIQAAIGSGFGISLYLILNWYLWGSPFTTDYNRFPLVANGHLVFTWPALTTNFGFNILTQNWYRGLFDWKVGLIPCNPVLLLLPIALYRLARQAERNIAIWLIFGLLESITVFSYSWWYDTPSGGNRFLLPVVLLGAIVVTAATQATWLRLIRSSEE
jgi:hypothetical protein